MLRKALEVKGGLLLGEGSNQYEVEKLLGRGTFGVVAKCVNLKTREVAAIKLVLDDCHGSGWREVEVMRRLRGLDPDEHNLIRFYGSFPHRHYMCLTLEMLDRTLLDFMCDRDFEPLRLSEVKVLGRQMLAALDALRGLDLVHGDIKPDNIMFVDQESRPLRVKLIDFGLAVAPSELPTGRKIQLLPFRAPEVILGLPLDHSIDMWALGSILAGLSIGRFLHPDTSEYDAIRSMVLMQGLPDQELLTNGLYVKGFFSRDHRGLWRLTTLEEYRKKTWISTASDTHLPVTDLDNLLTMQSCRCELSDAENLRLFVDLIKQMLEFNPERRIRPGPALRHPFINPEHSCRDSKSNFEAEAMMGDAQVPAAPADKHKTVWDSFRSSAESPDHDVWEDGPAPAAYSAKSSTSCKSGGSRGSCLSGTQKKKEKFREKDGKSQKTKTSLRRVNTLFNRVLRLMKRCKGSRTMTYTVVLPSGSRAKEVT